MRPKLGSAAAIGLLVFWLGSSGTSSAGTEHPMNPVVDRILLQPAQGSQVLLEAFRIDVLADGSRAVHGSHLSTGQRADHAFFFVVDPIAGTYQTTVVEPGVIDAFERLGPTYRGKAGYPEGASGEKDTPLPILHDPEDCPDACPDPCDGSWTAFLETWDPVFVPLTRTTAMGSWSEAGATGCRLRASGAGTCWSANPSALGTHWFTTQCAWSSLSSMVNVNATGGFVNYDFGLDTLSTSVSQSVRIELLPGLGVSTSFSHTDSGEFSGLIYGVVRESGRNTCF